MAMLLGDIAPGWLLDLNAHPTPVPAAPDWAAMRLAAPRDRAMQTAAVLHARLNPSLLHVLVVLRDEGDEGAEDDEGGEGAAPRVYLNTLPDAGVAVELANTSILATFPNTTISRVAWLGGVEEGREGKLKQSDFEEFLRTTKSNLYANHLPYDPTKRPYHTLVALGPLPEERVVGFVTLRVCLATSPFSGAAAATITTGAPTPLVPLSPLMPVITIDLIATDPSIRGGGLGGALLKLAISACFERRHGRPHGGYLLTEAVSTGQGWQFWQSRVTRKDPLAVSLAIQLICGVAKGVLTELALPCGTLLFPEPPSPADV